MLLLIPIGLLLLAAVAITLIDHFRPQFGTSWLIAFVTSFIAWLMVLFFRLRLPTTLTILNWSEYESHLTGNLSLLLDYDSWPYVIALSTITLAVILTDAARTRYDSTPRAWAAALSLTAFGLFALQSGSSLLLMFVWVLVDIIELLYLLGLKDSSQFALRIVISFGVRIFSILMLSVATSVGWQTSGDFSLAQIPASAGFFFLLAAGLRLGVFPINLPFLQEPNLRRGTGNILRLTPVIFALSLLARLPADLLIPSSLSSLTWLFRGLLASAALYAAARWMTAKDEIEGRPFWIIGWAALAMVSVLNGKPQASLAWGLALVLPGSLLFLYFPRIQRMNFLLHFGLVGLVGLPFTPVASGWSGLMGVRFSFWSFLFIIAHAMLVLGYLSRVFVRGGEAGILESWAKFVYPLGLIIIIQAILILGLIGWPGSLTLGSWWLGMISLLLIIGSIILVKKLGISPPYIRLSTSSRFFRIMDWVLPRIEPIFRLEWLYQTTWKIYNFLGSIVQGFSAILEGDGGILWMLLLFILLITLLTGIGSP